MLRSAELSSGAMVRVQNELDTRLPLSTPVGQGSVALWQVCRGESDEAASFTVMNLGKATRLFKVLHILCGEAE